jgi:aryl-alcohol dehydrogenase-like predicted oxidoreductase
LTDTDAKVAQRTLGCTGVSVSRLTLGTANFGSRWGPHWTLEKERAKRLVAKAYAHDIRAFDTANVYNQGESELWLGEILSALRLRDKVTVSTKFGYLTNPNDTQSGGSGRAPMRRAVEISLKRLRTEALDILYLHLWDRRTPIEETLSAAAELVTSGHIRSFALSNVPSWYLARAALLCRESGLPGLAAVQLNYNLLTRHLELDFGDLLKISGVDMIAWGPLANGLLSGRYDLDVKAKTLTGEGRLTGAAFTTGTVDPFMPVVAGTVSELGKIAQEIGLRPAQIALSWLLNQDLPTSVIIGVSNEQQLAEHLHAAECRLDDGLLERINAVSKPTIPYPQRFLEPDIQVLVHGSAVNLDD